MKKGDEKAFANLYEETKKGVFSYLYSICNNYERAEDLMQDTYIKVRQNIQSYQQGTNPLAWIIQIAKNLAFNDLKKARREQLTDFNSFDIADNTTVEEKADSYVFDTINRELSSDEAQIVLLHIISGFKHREIAEIVDKPLGTVLWSYNNSIKKLKKILKKEEE